MSLNYNKIWSLINRENLSKAKAARIVDMSETGFKQMMDRQTMSVSSLEKFANHFTMPISYFFDIEEKQVVVYPDKEKLNVGNEPCNKCEVLQAKLDGAVALVESQKQTIAALQGDTKKENQPKSSAQAS